VVATLTFPFRIAVTSEDATAKKEAR